jgi:hypothetical protein
MLLEIKFKKKDLLRIMTVPTEAISNMEIRKREITLHTSSVVCEVIYENVEDAKKDLELIKAVWYLKEYEGKNYIELNNIMLIEHTR